MGKTWRLPNKRVVEEQGNKWIIYPKPGYIEFIGSAEECWDYLVKRGILPPDNREETDDKAQGEQQVRRA